MDFADLTTIDSRGTVILTLVGHFVTRLLKIVYTVSTKLSLAQVVGSGKEQSVVMGTVRSSGRVALIEHTDLSTKRLDPRFQMTWTLITSASTRCV
jgi:hypothetical protein